MFCLTLSFAFQDELIYDEFENTLLDEELEEEVLEAPDDLESTPDNLQSVVTTGNLLSNASLEVGLCLVSNDFPHSFYRTT